MGLLSTLSFRKRSPLAPAAPALPLAVAAPAQAASVVPSAEAQAQAEELVRRVEQELPACLSVAVVEAATGRIVAGQWAGYGGEAAAAAHAEAVRQLNLGLAALQIADTDQLVDIVLTLGHQLHLLRVLPQAGWLLCLVVRAQDTNPALARAVLQTID